MARTDRAARDIAAPTDRVYAALVDREALARWLPPDGMTGRFERFDARVGGSYRMVLTYADGTAAPGKATADTDVVEARFVDLAPGRRVAQDVDFVSDDPAFAGTMTMIWEVSEAGNGSRVEFRAENVPPGISAEDHAAGLASSLANLAAYVET
ncbi:SRPBCC family protein [Solicola gregarius]|uniref:SRPBCC family protein n=1 Tax=Solicola gregarius TaxID=2908642 RepID=A0AA46TFW6_9ACTN|nr:SRPBCC family protein [Solicola gregarius]UYM04428.1 SRPBCC family protein [Solicola gregarius]